MPFVKLNPNDIKPEKRVSATKEETAEYVIPTGYNYILESLEDIEAIYLNHAYTKSRARIFHMTGHIRYLRGLLEENNIPFSKREAIVHDPLVKIPKKISKPEVKTVPPEHDDIRMHYGTYKFMPKIQHDYVPEPIEDVEEMYENMIACEFRSRIFRLTGHIRYLRQKLHENHIEFHEEKTDMKEEDTHFYTYVSRWGNDE